MIKNIVFDMGRVLVEYDPQRVAARYIEDLNERREVITSVFVSPEWLMLDMGIISEAEALLKMQGRLSSQHAREMAALCLEHWHEYNMWPKTGMERIVEQMKGKGFGIYLCSNASARMLTCYREVIPGVEYFDGILFSAEEKCIKPQKEIYLRLFEKFHLKPEECFFIDDVKANIDGARALGMDGYCFEDGDVNKLSERLRKLGSPYEK